MPLVEFMMHAASGGIPGKKEIPGFIRGSADFFNPADNTYVGWVADNRDYYLPDTVLVLTKESFAQRMVTMHQINPMKNFPTTNENGEEVEGTIMTDEEVIAMANEKYDYIVNHCKAEEGSL